MKRLSFAAIFLAVITVLFAADNPPAGGDDLYRFYSPHFLSEGASSVSLLSPQADAVNPAASGEQQRMTFDLSYLALSDFGGGGYGQVVNAGISVPSSFGVMSGSLHFLSLPFSDDLNLGTMGTLHLSFAKDLFPDLLVGAGLHFILGKQTRTSFAAGLDLGFIHMPGDIGFMKDFRWSGVLRNIGTGYKPVSDTTRSFPSLFTPAFGASFTAVRTADLDLSVTGDLSFPAFQNVIFKVGSGITFRNFISLETSLNLNAGDLAGNSSPSLIPSIGFAVNLNRTGEDSGDGSSNDWKSGELNIQTAAAPLYGSIWAFGAGANMPVGIIDSNPPVIAVDYQSIQYISPNHDGKNDYLEFPLSIRDERFIKGFRFVVSDKSGRTVREIFNKEERPENASFKTVIDRFAYVKKGIPVPETIRWDGMMDNGSQVEDGTYTFFIEAWDDNGNVGRTNAYAVVVDTEAPRIELKVPASAADLIFSPNSDGNKDTIAIVQSGSKEDRWDGKILDAAGQPVKTFSWKNDSPSSFPWDGKNLEGILAPDGVYSYEISSTDRAGNSVEKRLDNIIINTQQPPIGLSITKAFFSPNGDGAQDEIQLVPDVPVKGGIVDWTVSIQDRNGNVVATLPATGQTSLPVPADLSFSGKTSDGTVLPEGRYHAVLSVLYQNGHHPTADSPYFTLDVTPPSARVTANSAVFSPNGDGRKETLTFYQDTSREDSWSGKLVNEAGETVREFEWNEKADASFSWDGRGDDRRILPDGRYRFTLESVDRAGNRGASEPLTIAIDTTATPLALSTQDDAFSPNGDGLKDRLDIIPQIKVNEGIERWELAIFSEKDEPVIIQRGARREDLSFWWDGISSTGQKSQDGKYYAQLTLRYVNGNEPSARTGLFLLDTSAPRADVKANYSVFSPNGDGKKDEIVFVQETSREARWIGTVINAKGRPVKSFTWIGEAERNITWDGRGDDKLVQPDGEYVYRLASIDLAGNKGSAPDIRFEINTEETPLFLSAEFDAFSPNGDGIKDRIRLLPQVKVSQGIQSYRLEILDREGGIVRGFEGKHDGKFSFEWDGLTDGGKRAPDGSYSAQLSLHYANGNAPEAKTSAFILDTSAPKAAVKADYSVFSPNGDGNKDLITLSQETSREETWTGSIISAEGRVVKSFTWSGQAESRLIWDGRGNDKSIVADGSYTYRLTSLDEAGNRGVSADVGFTIDTAETPVFISTGYGSFSPNGDGTRDTIRLMPQVRVLRGIEKYDITISSEDGKIVRSFTGTGGSVPALSWDGKDGRGQQAGDGRYTARLTVNYENGNVPAAVTQPFVLDTVAPEIQLSLNRSLFSPNGDGKKDSITIMQTSSVEESWEGRIENGDGEVVRSYSWKNRTPNLVWDGRDEYGNAVKDGVYRYEITAADSAGNRTAEKLEGITVDTRPTAVFVTANRTGFSPNGDGRLDDITLSTIVNLREGIDSWSLSLVDQTGTVQKKFSGADLPPTNLRWDGRNDAGAVREGTYTAKFLVVYRKGDEPSAVTREFSLDTTPPRASVALDPEPFSPDNDGVSDEVSIGLSVHDRNAIENWTFEIRDPAGHPFISFDGKGSPTSRILWDGRSSSAEYVQAAEDYPYVLTVRDSLGNTGKVEGVIPVDVLVIRDGDRLKIRISSINFPPYKSNIVWENEEASAKNLKILKRLAEILNKYSSYRIRIEGHAVSEFWNIPARAEKEEVEELQPLSLARAEAVKSKLTELGVDAARISTLGRGGKEPVVPHSDLENRWKNRRVEFILLK